MPTPILMPALSPTMEEGKLAKWLVKEGDNVTSGMAIAEIETDKATMEVEAVDEGVVGKIMVPEGTEGVAVNTPIAVLLEEGESPAALKGYGAKPAQSSPQPAPAPKAAAASQAAPASIQESAPASGARARAPVLNETRPQSNGHSSERIFASPLARRLAKASGLDLASIRGSGPHGRIVRHDVEEAQANGGASLAAASAPSQSLVLARTSMPQPMTDEQILALYEEGSYEFLPHDNMRKTIAQRLTVAKAAIPHFYLTVDCELDALLSARQRLNARSPKDGPGAYKLSVNDFIIKAMGLALQRVPETNATWTERGLLMHKHSDVAVAVAVEGGLYAPVLRGVDQLSLAEISHHMKDLAERAHKRKLAPAEYQGGATAISNLGMYGIKSFDAVINPPQASILAVGQGEERAVAKNGQIKVATCMSCTLSCDHRVMDGATGAQLLTAFKAYIEDPIAMLV